jgi:hypothetical protein
MSLTHIRLNRIPDTNEIVSYRVESPDFNDQREWEDLGILNISRTMKNYKFIESNLAKESKLIPPMIYGLTLEKRNQLLNVKYSNYGWGAWSMCIHHWAVSFIRDNNYPDQYPMKP